MPIIIGGLGTVTEGLVQGTGGLGNKSVIKIGQNTKCPRDFRRLSFGQTPVINQQLMLEGKALKRVK